MYWPPSSAIFGVVARDVAAHQLQVVAAAPTDGKHRLVDRHDPPTESVGDLEATVWHGGMSDEGLRALGKAGIILD